MEAGHLRRHRPGTRTSRTEQEAALVIGDQVQGRRAFISEGHDNAREGETGLVDHASAQPRIHDGVHADVQKERVARANANGVENSAVPGQGEGDRVPARGELQLLVATERIGLRLEAIAGDRDDLDSDAGKGFTVPIHDDAGDRAHLLSEADSRNNGADGREKHDNETARSHAVSPPGTENRGREAGRRRSVRTRGRKRATERRHTTRAEGNRR